MNSTQIWDEWESAAKFYDRERSRESHIAWLFDRCFREMDAIPNFSRTLVQDYHVWDRDGVPMLSTV